ncbi:hypothetical protein U1Q18_049356, partial [Sarracenia purpurea var. burkii]
GDRSFPLQDGFPTLHAVFFQLDLVEESNQCQTARRIVQNTLEAVEMKGLFGRKNSTIEREAGGGRQGGNF